MNKSFSDGLMAGLVAHEPVITKTMLSYSIDYRKGFVCGFSYALEKLCSDSTMAQYQAGQLAYFYQLEHELLSDFFTDFSGNHLSDDFTKGYNSARLSPAS